MLKDYDETAKTFQWEDAEKNFSWFETGKLIWHMKQLIGMLNRIERIK